MRPRQWTPSPEAAANGRRERWIHRQAQGILLEQCRAQEIREGLDPDQSTSYSIGNDWFFNYPLGTPNKVARLLDLDHAMGGDNLIFRSGRTFYENSQQILGVQCPIGIEDRQGRRRWLAHISFSNKPNGSDSAYLRFVPRVRVPSPGRTELFDTEHVSFNFDHASGQPTVSNCHLTSEAVPPKDHCPATRAIHPREDGFTPIATFSLPFSNLSGMPAVGRWYLAGAVSNPMGPRFESANAHARANLQRAITERLSGKFVCGWLDSTQYFPDLGHASQSKLAAEGARLLVGVAVVSATRQASILAKMANVLSDLPGTAVSPARYWMGPQCFPGRGDNYHLLVFHFAVAASGDKVVPDFDVTLF